jgi:hypothetical protein
MHTGRRVCWRASGVVCRGCVYVNLGLVDSCWLVCYVLLFGDGLTSFTLPPLLTLTRFRSYVLYGCETVNLMHCTEQHDASSCKCTLNLYVQSLMKRCHELV